MMVENAVAAPTGDALTIRMMEERDIPSLLALFKLCFNTQPSETYIRWRYVKTPGEATPTVLAFDGDTCAASYAAWPVALTLNGQPVKAAQSMDTMTHPEYRGRGLFTLLAEKCYGVLAERGYQVIYGFPNANSYPGFIRRLNWDHVCDIPRGAAPLRCRIVAPKSHAGQGQLGLAATTIGISHRGRRPAPRHGSLACRTLSGNEESVPGCQNARVV